MILREWLARLTDWAEGRALSADFCVAVSLPLALCSAVWFSGHAIWDIGGGVLALCGWLLARTVAVRLAGWPAVAGPVGQEFTWLCTVCSVAGECAIYGGIAAGGQSGGWPGTWPLAVMTIVSVAGLDMLAVLAQGGTLLAGGHPRTPDGLEPPQRAVLAQGGTLLVGIGRIPPASAGLRVALAGIAVAAAGPRVALGCVLVANVASIGVVGWQFVRHAPRLARQELVVACRDDGALACWAGRLVLGSLVPLPPICAGVGAVALLAALGLGNLPPVVALAPLMALLLAAPGSAHPHDGRADWLSPVLLALGQFIYLAALGFGRQVPGPLVFALCAVTATWYAAEPSRSPPGAFRAPSGLVARSSLWRPGGAAEPSRSPPGAFRAPSGLVARSSLRRPDGAAPFRLARALSPPASPSARSRSGPGWESRLFIVTFAAVAGLASAGYLGLSVYLGVLICRKGIAGYLTPQWAV